MAGSHSSFLWGVPWESPRPRFQYNPNVIGRLFLGMAVAGLLVSQGYRLERQPKVGEESRLRVSAQIDMQGSTAFFSSLQVEKVTAVEANGDYTVESRQTDARITFGGQTTAIPEAAPMAAVYRASGELATIKADIIAASEVRVSRMNGFVSPGREVKVGDSWSHDYKPSPQNGQIGGKSEFKLESKENQGERPALVVKFNYKESSGDRPASSNGKMWIDAERGILLRLESDWANAPMPGSPAPMNAKITILREN